MLKCLRVGVGAPALIHNRLVPKQTESLQGAKDFVGRTGHLARPVEVVDANQPASARGAGIGVATDGGNE